MNDPDVAYSVHVWESQELLDAHAQSSHHDRRIDELRQWNVTYEQITYYHVAKQRDMLDQLTPR